jgi:Tol biopolymer transport system component
VESDPAWSPDGTRIAAAQEPTKNPLSKRTTSRLWVVHVATGAKRLLSEGDAMQPSWSPHGQRIAYWGLRPQGGQRDLWTIPAEGGPPADVTNDEAVDWDPVWSPDGRWLYFSSSRGGSMNLWRIGIDEATGRVSGGAEPLTTPAAWSGQISLARDGRHIAYATRDQRSNLFRVDFDPLRGVLVGVPKPVLAGSRVVFSLSLSPDGEWIAFTNEGVQENLFIVRADGSEYRQLTDDPRRNRVPAWSPDGTRIAFVSDRGGRYEIWVIRPDGSGLERLVASSHDQSIGPAWSPDARSLSVIKVGTLPRSSIVQVGRPLEDPTTRRLPPIPGGLGFWATSWSPDGGQLVGMGVGEDDRVTGIFAYSLASGEYEKLIGTEPSFQLNAWPTWLADGRHVAYVEQGRLLVLDYTSRQSHELLPLGTPAGARTYSFSRDSRTLVYASTATEGDVWLMTLE